MGAGGLGLLELLSDGSKGRRKERHEMTDYISREAVIALAKDICVLTKWDSEYRHRSIDPLDVIELPAADVRPVVTCGECKYWELSKIEPLYHVCTYLCGVTFVREAEDYCSRGEKREES